MVLLKILVGIALLCDSSVGLTSSRHRLSHLYPTKKSVVRLHSEESNRNGITSNSDKDFFESNREKALKTLNTIETLEQKLQGMDEHDDDVSLTNEIQEVEKEVTSLISQTLPPKGLSVEEYKAAIKTFLGLPLILREALCEATGFKGLSETQAYFKGPEVIAAVYEQGPRLTQKRLNDALKEVQARRQSVSSSAKSVPEGEEEMERLLNRLVVELGDGKSLKQIETENTVEQFLPRVTRKEGREVSQRDLDSLMAVLDKEDYFSVTKPPETVPGGYVVRGTNTKVSGEELVKSIDAKVPANSEAQVCYLEDLTSSVPSDDPVLLLINKDMAPTTSRLILSFSTAAALTTAFLFAFETYGNNNAISSYISDLTGVGDYSAVNWFNYKLMELLLPLVAIQGLHEIGHYLIASRDKITTAPPTLLPFWILPFMGAQTQLKTSPKDRKSLFDFAFFGPFLGIGSSLLFLGYGLQSTVAADAQTIQYFPMLPVEILKVSTLGGAIVDAFLGSSGAIASQDPTTSIPLHPFAVAGFCGLVISALDLLPLGSTDGGRLSQSIFGRKRHLLLGSFTWTAIFLSSFFTEHHDVLLYAWVLNNLTQNDMEVPCRNEVDPLGWPRVVAGNLLWFVAYLTLLPME